MRIGLGRWAAAGLPLTLFALTACGGPEGADAKSPADERRVSSIDESSRDVSGRDSDRLPSRDGDSRGSGVVGESAGPGGEQGPEDGPVATKWPVDDVSGALPRTAPDTGDRGGRRDPVLLTYDAGAADGYTGAIRAAARSWTDRVPEIELRPARQGTQADIRFVATDGWPGAEPQGSVLGKGTVVIGRRALAEGHDGIRVVSHELGHLLGLKDDQPGPCSSVMSGKSPGASCTNSDPNAAEVREVRGNFGAGSRTESAGAVG
ncbi:snapalysin family zinc-dependent metalloprotease [Streptomyces marispadix]|uniref:Extracellular small neutral protease n=1 Tax=Streptomyces marispadix TaxID=2922868 RepID=A0ABS9SVS3_9ACTN|nr:snapalysin family zinc-dependent metalloprotease [Streptomyces marispadix]MCH6160377.1 snapalysin family zinc-dependent metalloprotease [Streptomyces marispadix]